MGLPRNVPLTLAVIWLLDNGSAVAVTAHSDTFRPKATS